MKKMDRPGKEDKTFYLKFKDEEQIKEAWFRGWNDLPFQDQLFLLDSWNRRKRRNHLGEVLLKAEEETRKRFEDMGMHVSLSRNDYFSKIF